jgi:hypothetical protein
MKSAFVASPAAFIHESDSIDRSMPDWRFLALRTLFINNLFVACALRGLLSVLRTKIGMRVKGRRFFAA